ncbi:MAG: tonB-system energizer ExbB, partial [Starkeya sp.]|nr:tonB-system energizer ExbB [Starkeya sp.]
MPTTPKTTALRRALNLVLALALLVAGPVGAWAQESSPASPALSAPPAATAPAAPTFDPLVPPASGTTAPSPAGEAAPVAVDPQVAAPSAAAPSVAAPATGDAAADPAAGLPLEAGEDASVAAQLPHDLSPWGMFMAADWVVKAVMIGLAFASVVTWTVWLAKTMELAVAKGRLRRALKGYLASATLE